MSPHRPVRDRKDVRGHARWLALALAALGACDLTRAAPDPDAAVVDGFPPPQPHVVPALGSADTLDLACWNIENFPQVAAQTPSDVADLITSLDLDVVVVEEIASQDAWDELLARLPEHDGVLSTHQYTATSYQKIGIIYRTTTVSIDQVELLFQNDTSAFPRPPLHAHLHFDDGVHAPVAFELVGLHLKAGITDDDIARRKLAFVAIDAWQRGRADTGTIFLGDWNQELDTHDGPAVWAPVTAAPDIYTIRTQAASVAGEATYIPSRSMIDHMVSTAAAAPILGTPTTIVPHLDTEYNPYPQVSDHRPVVLTIPLTAK